MRHRRGDRAHNERDDRVWYSRRKRAHLDCETRLGPPDSITSSNRDIVRRGSKEADNDHALIPLERVCRYSVVVNDEQTGEGENRYAQEVLAAVRFVRQVCVCVCVCVCV